MSTKTKQWLGFTTATAAPQVIAGLQLVSGGKEFSTENLEGNVAVFVVGNSNAQERKGYEMFIKGMSYAQTA